MSADRTPTAPASFSLWPPFLLLLAGLSVIVAASAEPEADLRLLVRGAGLEGFVDPMLGICLVVTGLFTGAARLVARPRPDPQAERRRAAIRDALGREDGEMEDGEEGEEPDAAVASELDEALRRALADRTLRLVYRPVVNFADRTVPLVTALPVLPVDDGAPVSGRAVAGLAARRGCSLDLLLACLDRAAEDLKAVPSGLAVLVDMPRALRCDLTLVETLRQRIERAGLPASRLVLGLPERTVAADPAAASAFCEVLRETGLRFCLTGFGAGGCAPIDLARVPAEYVRLDPALIGAVTGRDDRTGPALLALAAGLKATMIVPDLDGLPRLAGAERLGAALGEGAVLGRPLPALGLPGLVAGRTAVRAPEPSVPPAEAGGAETAAS